MIIIRFFMQKINVGKIKKKLLKNGFCIINNFYSIKKCNYFKKEILKILKERTNKSKYTGSKNSIVLYNYFEENLKLSELVYNKKLDNILSSIIDAEYVLNNAVVRNISNYRPKSKKFKNVIGTTSLWHTDSRFIQNTAIYPPINYLLITPLENFNKANGATKYVPNSHKILKRRKNQKIKNFKYLEAKQGSLIIMDVNLLHKAGDPSHLSRWSVWNKYSPWFVKPYFQFDKIIKNKKISKKLKKILHFNSIPPENYTSRRSTVTKL